MLWGHAYNTRLAQSVERQPFTMYNVSWWSRVQVPHWVGVVWWVFGCVCP